MTLKLGRGVNIEGWLSHQDRPVADRPLYFDTRDAERVTECGFEHIRINVNEKHLWDDDGQTIEKNFDRVSELLDACVRLGLKAVFDLHVLRSHHFKRKDNALFNDPDALARFLEIWRALSQRLRGWSTDVLAYEFLNEPVANPAQAWNRVSSAAHRVLRDLEPDRTLVLGSNGYSGPGSFASLQIPDDDKLILTFHFYRPFIMTHHAVRRRDDGMHLLPVTYPGLVIADADLAKLPKKRRELMRKDNGPYNRALLRRQMSVAIDVAADRGMPLYCGEWGCYDTVPHEIRLRWWADMVSILDEEGIDWAVYAYRNRWGVVLDNKGQFDPEGVEAMLGADVAS